MSGLGWLSFLIVGLIAGWVAEKVMKRDHGLIMNLVVGVVGAYLGRDPVRAAGSDLDGLRRGAGGRHRRIGGAARHRRRGARAGLTRAQVPKTDQPVRRARSSRACEPRSELPTALSPGDQTAMAARPGAMARMPPPTPLLPGSPTR